MAPLNFIVSHSVDVEGMPHRNWHLFIPVAIDIVSRLCASLLNERSNSVARIVTPRLRHALLAENAGMLVLARQWYTQLVDLVGGMDLEDWAAKIRIGVREHEVLDMHLPDDVDARDVAQDEI